MDWIGFDWSERDVILVKRWLFCVCVSDFFPLRLLGFGGIEDRRCRSSVSQNIC